MRAKLPQSYHGCQCFHLSTAFSVILSKESASKLKLLVGVFTFICKSVVDFISKEYLNDMDVVSIVTMLALNSMQHRLYSTHGVITADITGSQAPPQWAVAIYFYFSLRLSHAGWPQIDFVAEDDFEHLILLFPPPKYWDYYWPELPC